MRAKELIKIERKADRNLDRVKREEEGIEKQRKVNAKSRKGNGQNVSEDN